jgi:hypothetical protein
MLYSAGGGAASLAAVAAVAAGLLAMYSSHPGNIRPIQKYVKDNGAQWSWDVVPHPATTGKRPVPVLFTNGLYLWKGIKNEGPATEAL